MAYRQALLSPQIVSTHNQLYYEWQWAEQAARTPLDWMIDPYQLCRHEIVQQLKDYLTTNIIRAFTGLYPVDTNSLLFINYRSAQLSDTKGRAIGSMWIVEIPVDDYRQVGFLTQIAHLARGPNPLTVPLYHTPELPSFMEDQQSELEQYFYTHLTSHRDGYFVDKLLYCRPLESLTQVQATGLSPIPSPDRYSKAVVAGLFKPDVFQKRELIIYSQQSSFEAIHDNILEQLTFIADYLPASTQPLFALYTPDRIVTTSGFPTTDQPQFRLQAQRFNLSHEPLEPEFILPDSPEDFWAFAYINDNVSIDLLQMIRPEKAGWRERIYGALLKHVLSETESKQNIVQTGVENAVRRDLTDLLVKLVVGVKYMQRQSESKKLNDNVDVETAINRLKSDKSARSVVLLLELVRKYRDNPEVANRLLEQARELFGPHIELFEIISGRRPADVKSPPTPPVPREQPPRLWRSVTILVVGLTFGLLGGLVLNNSPREANSLTPTESNLSPSPINQAIAPTDSAVPPTMTFTPTVDVAATQVAIAATLTADYLDAAGTMTAAVPPTPIITITPSTEVSSLAGCTVRAARGLVVGVSEPEFFTDPFSNIYVRSEPLLRNTTAGQAINSISTMANTETLVTGAIVGEPNPNTGEESGTVWWRVDNYFNSTTGTPVNGWVSSGTTAVSGDCTQLPKWQLNEGHTAATLSADNTHFSFLTGTWRPTVYGTETRLPFFGQVGQVIALACKNCKVKLSTLDGQVIQDFGDGGLQGKLTQAGDYMFVIQVTNNNPTYVTLVIQPLS